LLVICEIKWYEKTAALPSITTEGCGFSP